MSNAYQNYPTGPSGGTLLAGSIVSSRGRGDEITSLANNTLVKQVQTLQATSTSYAVTLTRGNVSRSFSGSGLADANASAADLKAKIDADPQARAFYESVTVATDTVTLTAKLKGTAGAVTYSATTNITSTETTSASAGSAAEFGLFVMHGSTAGELALPTGTGATAKVVDLTPAAANTTDYYAGYIDSDGTVLQASFLSDGSATVQEIVEGLQPVLDALGAAVNVTEDNTKLTLTAATAGDDFEVLAGSSNSSATWTITNVTANVTNGFTRALAGVVVRRESVGSTIEYGGGEGSAASSYAAGKLVPVMEAGEIVCLTDGTVSRFGDVYVRVTASGSEKIGSVRSDSDGGDCLLLPGARMETAATGTASNHAPVVVRFNQTAA